MISAYDLSDAIERIRAVRAGSGLKVVSFWLRQSALRAQRETRAGMTKGEAFEVAQKVCECASRPLHDYEKAAILALCLSKAGYINRSNKTEWAGHLAFAKEAMK